MTAAGDNPGRGPVIGRLAELWRYPVESLGGERLACATVQPRGMAGDRIWAVRGKDGRIGSGKRLSGTGPFAASTIGLFDGPVGAERKAPVRVFARWKRVQGI